MFKDFLLIFEYRFIFFVLVMCEICVLSEVEGMVDLNFILIYVVGGGGASVEY